MTDQHMDFLFTLLPPYTSNSHKTLQLTSQKYSICINMPTILHISLLLYAHFKGILPAGVIQELKMHQFGLYLSNND